MVKLCFIQNLYTFFFSLKCLKMNIIFKIEKSIIVTKNVFTILQTDDHSNKESFKLKLSKDKNLKY